MSQRILAEVGRPLAPKNASLPDRRHRSSARSTRTATAGTSSARGSLTCHCSGGHAAVIRDWTIDAADLTVQPSSFYKVPAALPGRAIDLKS